jgi:hypothetical protein
MLNNVKKAVLQVWVYCKQMGTRRVGPERVCEGSSRPLQHFEALCSLAKVSLKAVQVGGSHWGIIALAFGVVVFAVATIAEFFGREAYQGILHYELSWCGTKTRRCRGSERRSMSKMQVGCGGEYATLRRCKLAVDTHVRMSLYAQGAWVADK